MDNQEKRQNAPDKEAASPQSTGKAMLRVCCTTGLILLLVGILLRKTSPALSTILLLMAFLIFIVLWYRAQKQKGNASPLKQFIKKR